MIIFRRFSLLATILLTLTLLAGCASNGDRDATPPKAISDLQETAVTTSSVALSWTAPSDNGDTGRAVSYELRYSTDPLTAGNFAAATLCAGLPAPASAGTTQNYEVTGLLENTTYYFAMISVDDDANESKLSNVVASTTAVSGPLAEIHYDGDNNEGVGLGGGGTFIVAARFTNTQLGDFVGANLSAVKVYNYLAVATTFTVKVYGNGTASSAGAELYSQAFTVQPGWNTLEITPVTIPADDLWVGYEVTHANAEWPVGFDTLSPYNADGEWFSLDGGASWMNAGIGMVNLRLVITAP